MKTSRKESVLNSGFILTFIIVFVSNDTLLFGTNENRLFFGIHIGILLVSFSYMIFSLRSINKRVLWFLLYLIAVMMVTQVINLDTEYQKYYYNIFVLVFCVLFCEVVNIKVFCNAFSTIIYYIAVFAIVLFVLWMIAPGIIRSLPSITNESGIRYFWGGLGFAEDLNLNILPRMYGIFREPGVFACFLVMALFIQLYFIEQLNIKRVVAISVAAILTFSTAAYILVFFVLASYGLKQMQSQKKEYKKKYLLFLILVVVAWTIFCAIGPDEVVRVVFGKLSVENSSRDSRFGSIAANFRMFLQNPILGKGWNYVEENFVRFANMGKWKGDHNTNTFLKFLALYGVGPFAGVVWATFAFFKKMCRSTVWGLYTTVVWTIALSNADMSVNILFYLLPFYGIGKDEKRMSCL